MAARHAEVLDRLACGIRLTQ